MRKAYKLSFLGLILACGGSALNAVPPLGGPIPVAPSPIVSMLTIPFVVRSQAIHLATGDDVTPDAAPGSVVLPLVESGASDGFAASLATGGTTLALLTSGYNRGNRGPRPEHVYLFDVAGGAPVQRQVLAVPNAFWGLAYDGDALWVSGGSDDAVVRFDGATPSTTKLGHEKGLGLGQGPYAAGLAPWDGGVVVANHQNDSISIVKDGRIVAEIDLRPADAKPGGDYPAGVATFGDRAYVTCQRSGELVEIALDERKVRRRLVVGAQPTKMVLSRDGGTIFVANAGSDDVAVVDRGAFAVRERIDVFPEAWLPRAARHGANPNALALSADEKRMFVSEGGLNAVAIVEFGPTARVVGFVPTGFYPNDVATRGDFVYVAYGKSATGPNVGGPRSDHPPAGAPVGIDAFSLSLLRGGLHAFPRPEGAVLAALTKQVLVNAHLDAPPPAAPIFEKLRGKVKHVVFVVGENRTYDQVLGDVAGADGDPSLVHWGQAIAPNQHALAREYVTMDRFFASGGVSGDGWQWTVAGRTTDPTEKELPLMYAGRGKHSYDWEGSNRGINVGLATLGQRRTWNPKTPNDARLLPGVMDVAAPRQDVPFLWDAARAAGLTLRNYGFFAEDVRYDAGEKDPAFVPLLRDPAKTKTRVAFPTAPGLLDATDPYFRGFDMKFPDSWRVDEWMRELRDQRKTGAFPALTMIRLPHDHFGSFKSAVAGVDTPDTQMADHDWALGRIVEAIGASPFWDDTVIVVVEDDAQDGADHVDSHRSLLFFAGGHVARGAVVHTSYATPNVLRTVEVLLGLPPLGRNDAVAAPIAEVFTEDAAPLTFHAVVPDVLRTTKLELPPPPKGAVAMRPRGTAAEWDARTAGMDFSDEDRLDAAAFNEALYCGLVSAVGCTSANVMTAERDDDD